MTSNLARHSIKYFVLGHLVFLDLVLGAAVIAIWYATFLRMNRRRASQAVRWIERAFAAHGQVTAVQWLAPSRFRVRMRFSENLFRRPAFVVQLLPREMPFNWLISRWRKRQETLTFEADLDCPPAFNLEVHNFRWCGRTRRQLKPSLNWETEYTGPFVISTRNDWQREATTMMNVLVASRDCDCMNVRIARRSPHFSATVPLESVSPQSEAQTELFDILRELAAGASTTPS